MIRMATVSFTLTSKLTRFGNATGEFNNLHNLGIDSHGNIYTAEVQGKRVQKFVYQGEL